MASMFTYATDPKRPDRKSGRGVAFIRPDGKRRTLKLGTVNRATIRDLKSRIESLVECRTLRRTPGPELL